MGVGASAAFFNCLPFAVCDWIRQNDYVDADIDFLAVAAAFDTLVNESWPGAHPGAQLQHLSQCRDVASFRRQFAGICESLRAKHPMARFWWKNEASQFLGACSAFVVDSGLEPEELFAGIADDDARLPWTRQAVLYMRDDKKVFSSNRAKIDIVERQDRPGGTVWLKTSKVPYRNRDGLTGGTVGGFEVISTAEAWTLSRKR